MPSRSLISWFLEKCFGFGFSSRSRFQTPSLRANFGCGGGLHFASFASKAACWSLPSPAGSSESCGRFGFVTTSSFDEISFLSPIVRESRRLSETVMRHARRSEREE